MSELEASPATESPDDPARPSHGGDPAVSAEASVHSTVESPADPSVESGPADAAPRRRRSSPRRRKAGSDTPDEDTSDTAVAGADTPIEEAAVDEMRVTENERAPAADAPVAEEASATPVRRRSRRRKAEPADSEAADSEAAGAVESRQAASDGDNAGSLPPPDVASEAAGDVVPASGTFDVEAGMADTGDVAAAARPPRRSRRAPASEASEAVAPPAPRRTRRKKTAAEEVEVPAGVTAETTDIEEIPEAGATVGAADAGEVLAAAVPPAAPAPLTQDEVEQAPAELYEAPIEAAAAESPDAEAPAAESPAAGAAAGTEDSAAATGAAMPLVRPLRRRSSRRRPRPAAESSLTEAMLEAEAPEAAAPAEEALLDAVASHPLAPASEESEEAPPELVAEEAELLGALEGPSLSESDEELAEALEAEADLLPDEAGRAAARTADETILEALRADGASAAERLDEEIALGVESGELAEAGPSAEPETDEAAEQAEPRSRRRRRRRRRRTGLSLQEEAAAEAGEETVAPGEEALPSARSAEPFIDEAEALELLSDEADEESAELPDVRPEEAAVPAEGEEAESGRRYRRVRQPFRRSRGRRPAVEQTLIQNPEDPDAAPLRIDIQPGVGHWLIGRSIIGFREAYDIGGGDRPRVSFQVMVLDDGTEWRVRGSEDFDPWLERLLPGEDA